MANTANNISSLGTQRGKVARIPVLALRNLVAIPNAIIHIDIGRKHSAAAAKYALTEGTNIMLVAQKDAVESTVDRRNLFDTGTIATVRQILKTGKEEIRVVFECMGRGCLGGAQIEND